MKKMKEKRGRKPIDPDDKIMPIVVYFRAGLIKELGGEKELKEKITIAVELKEIWYVIFKNCGDENKKDRLPE